MRPRLPLAVVAVAAMGALVATGCTSSVSAFQVGGRDVSQRSVDDELAILNDHPKFAAGLVGQELASSRGSVPTTLAAAWVTFRILADYSAHALAKGGGTVTAADRKATGLEGAVGFDRLPAGFRKDLVEGFASIRALQRTLVAQAPDQARATALASCASKRYVAHILVKTRAEADALKQRLARGEDFATLAASSSIDTSATQGGQLGCLDDLNIVDPFATVARTQPLGTVSDPVETQFGFHLIQVTDQPPSSVLDQVALTEILARVGRADVEVDSRYGRWTRSQGRVLVPRGASTSAN